MKIGTINTARRYDRPLGISDSGNLQAMAKGSKWKKLMDALEQSGLTRARGQVERPERTSPNGVNEQDEVLEGTPKSHLWTSASPCLKPALSVEG